MPEPLSLRGVYWDAANSKLLYRNTDGGYTEISAGGVTIPDTLYASNTDAVADLGVGALYKSTTFINDSPIILITV